MMRPSYIYVEAEDRAWPARCLAGRWLRTGMAMLVVLALAGSLWAGGSPAQKQKKKKNDTQDQPTDTRVPMPDSQAIDIMISQMLGAWQVGDVDAMHKYYADDLVMVSGSWEPPLIGWDNYIRAYQAQRARVQGGRLDRTNTYTKVMGDTAWVVYQWEFIGQVDGRPMDALGHTSLVVQKRSGNWIIVMNHTSAVTSSATAAPVAPTPASPSTSAAPAGPGN